MPIKKLVLQYAALPYRFLDGVLEVMLITSRETQRWVIPKGWPEKNMSAHVAAAHEAYEEAGIRGDISDLPYATFDYMKRMPNDKRKRCTVLVFPLAVRKELDDWPEKGQRKREWVSPAEAASRVAEIKLIDMLTKLATEPLPGAPFFIP